MSTTEYIIITSRVPTYGCTWPLASVLTISFGTPTGSGPHRGRADGRAGRTAEAEHAGELALLVQFGRDLRDARGRQFDGLAAIARRLSPLVRSRRPRRTPRFARNVRRRTRADRARRHRPPRPAHRLPTSRSRT